MRQLSHWSAVSLVLLLVSACGQTPGAAPRPARMQPPPAMAPAGGPSLAANTAARTEGERIKVGAQTVFQQANGFEAEAYSYSEGYYKGGNKTPDFRQSWARTKVTFQKPAKMRGEVLDTNNSLLRGGAMATRDGINLTVRAGGFLSILPLKMQSDSKSLHSNRDHDFREGMPDRLLSRLTAPGCTWTAMGDEVVEGVPTRMVLVEGARRLDKEIDRELVAVDPATFTIRRILMYAGGKRVMEYRFKTFRWNPVVSASKFDL